VKQKVVVFGPGPQFKGGISNFTVSLCKAFEALDAEVHLVSWIRQYPAIIPRDFMDRSSGLNPLKGTKVQVHELTDYNLPLTWGKTVREICRIQPDLIVFQWAIAIQGLPLGYICRKLKKRMPGLRIVFDVHNVVQKETGLLDRILTRYALKAGDEFIFHGRLTREEFSQFLPEIRLVEAGEAKKSPGKRCFTLFHPMYDIFGSTDSFDVVAEKRKLGLGSPVFLFFGFIRKYKGLHYAIEAFANLVQSHPEATLLIVGESFWNQAEDKRISVKVKSWVFGLAKKIFIRKSSNEKDYQPLELIQKFGIEKHVRVVNRFIPNEEVHKWFMLSDAVVNFYEYATPSGVESLAYYFAKPVLATSVGHFAYAIEDGKNGYLARAGDVASMAGVMERFIQNPIAEESVRASTGHMVWSRYASRILYPEGSTP